MKSGHLHEFFEDFWLVVSLFFHLPFLFIFV